MAKRINLDLNTEPIAVNSAPSAATTSPTKPKTPKIKKAKNNFELIEDFLMKHYDFRLNEISVEIEVSAKGEQKWEVLNENNIYYRLYKAGFKSFTTIVQTLFKNDFTRSRFNPFTSYFYDLPKYQESEGDLIQKLASFVEVEPQHRQLFEDNYKKMLVRTVACAVRRLPFNKQCFILQGKQNDGKSSFVRYHIPPILDKYYTDHFNPENLDDIKRIAQCLIINLDEMASLSRKDINKIKSIISTDSVRMRLPYDARDSNLPRVASFFGTTNDDEFLTDPTGSVRWIVFKTLSINHDNGGANGYCAVDINRVWAQAMSLLDTGFDYKLSDQELKEIETINRGYQITTQEQEYLTRYFEPCDQGTEILTSSEIIEYIKANHKDLQLNPINIGKALTFLKFEKGQKYNGRFQVKGYKIKKIDVFAPTPSVPNAISAAQATSYRVDKRFTEKALKEKNNERSLQTQEDLPF